MFDLEFEDECVEETGLDYELGAVCRGCGCTDAHACEGGCIWVTEDLCSACVRGGVA